MNKYHNSLKGLFNVIPTYGFGSTLELYTVCTNYLKVLVEIRKENPERDTVRNAIRNAQAIRKVVRKAIESRVPREVKSNFDKASNALGLEIEEMIGEFASESFLESVNRQYGKISN